MKYQILRTCDLSKSFSQKIALDNLSYDLYKGEILGTVGLSNSGKSTLSKILSGLLKCDSGHIYIDEKEVIINSQKDAKEHGIYYIDQQPRLIPQLSIAENIFLICPQPKDFWINRTKINRMAKDIFEKMGFRWSPEMKVMHLSRLQQYIIETIKARVQKARIIIIDEPNLYHQTDLDLFYDIILQLKNEGMSIQFMDSKPDNLMRIADRIMLLRDGKNIGTFFRNEFSKDMILGLLVDKGFSDEYIRKNREPMEKVFCIQSQNSDLSINVRSGEIVGIADYNGIMEKYVIDYLLNNNRQIIMKIYKDGVFKIIKDYKYAIKNGLGLIRKNTQDGNLFRNMNVIDNHNIIFRNKISSWISRRLYKFVYNEFSDKLNVAGPNVLLSKLSLEDQERVLMYKWLAVHPKVIIITYPTFGADLVMRKFIYSLLDDACNEGIGILLFSTNTSELINISNRIYVIYNGVVKEELLRKDFDKLKDYI